MHTALIEFFAWIGWATDLKTNTTEEIEQRKQRTGQKVDEKAFYKNNSMLDWITGCVIGLNIFWVVFLYRNIVNQIKLNGIYYY